MNKKESILEKVNTLITYAISQGYDSSLLDDLMSPLLTQVNSFYNLDLSGMLENCIKALTHAQIRTGIIYKGGYTVPYSLDGAPSGYSDITDLFNFEADLMNTSGATFTASISESTDAITGEQFYISSLVDSWISSAAGAVQSVPGSLKSIASFSNSLGLGATLKNLLEPSDVESVPKLEDIAEDIYNTRKYLLLINTMELGVYIPTNFRS